MPTMQEYRQLADLYFGMAAATRDQECAVQLEAQARMYLDLAARRKAPADDRTTLPPADKTNR